jgi:hypothetical protein
VAGSVGKLRFDAYTWKLVILITSGVAAFVGTVMLTSERSQLGDPFSVGLFLVVTVACIYWFIRALGPAVTIDANVVCVRGFVRTRRYPKVEVENIRCEIIDEKFLLVWAPCLYVRSRKKMLMAGRLGGYSISAKRPNRRVARQVELMRDALGIQFDA